MPDVGHLNITIAKIIKIANKNKTIENKYNKQIQRVYVPRHFMFVFEYMNYHGTT